MHDFEPVEDPERALPSYLLEHGRLVDLLPGDVAHLEDAQGEGLQRRVLDQVGTVHVETGKHRLRQGVTLQPCNLDTHA